MKLTANELLKMQIIDEVIKEPIGGAHRNKEQIISSTKEVLKRCLQEFKEYSREEILEKRKEKFLSIGKQKSFKVFSDNVYWTKKDNILNPFIDLTQEIESIKYLNTIQKKYLFLHLTPHIILVLNYFLFFLDLFISYFQNFFQGY